MIDETLFEAEEKMEKTVESAKEAFAGIRTGRAHPGMFQKVLVDYYGAPTPLQQLASFQNPEARTIIISPFDKGSMRAIEKAIQDADPALLQELGVDDDAAATAEALRAQQQPDTPVCDRCHNLVHHSVGTPIAHPTAAAIQQTIAESPHRRNHIYHVVDAADSIAFRLMFNSMRAAYEPAIEALAGVLAAEVDQIETYLALADALAAGDPRAAEQAARQVLEPGTQALIRTIELLDVADPDSGVTTPDPKEAP